ncbi:hypothetical protein F511_32825 [Dorcoceras hygrometricum]|uniref:Uncharacterized protein n=1 Tax=Dorcoceras hygrometricum TaxID=472368 RepID=A0A2Z7CJ35_9LAMI|nr:hypothetical protein F511_32825 [Dorcoceras hygrometricum]
MRTRSDKRPSHKHDRKVLMAEESTKSWADTDSESSSSSSSSSDSEQEEVHCLMADQTLDDEVFDFSNIEFTREDLVQALNYMVHEYKTLSHTFEEIKAENASLKNSSAESSSDELEDTDSLKTVLSKLRIENELLRSESCELKAEVEKLTKEMSSWTQSARAFHKLQEIQKSAHDRTVLVFSNSESSEGETSTQSQPAYDKFNKMSFVKVNVIHDCFESIIFYDQNSSQLSYEGKDGIGYQRPENPKPSWLKNRLDKDKAKAGSKYYVQHQPWRNSRKAKSGWRKTQPRRDLYGQHMKSKLNRSHCNHAQTLKDTYTGNTVKVVMRCGWYQQVTPKSNAQVGLKLIVKCFKESDLEIDSDFEESYSDAPTVYRSPSPFLQEADSFALGPAIFSGVAQEEQLYYVESPESPPPLPQREESSSSSWDSQMHFYSTDIPLDATTEAQTSIPAAPVDFSPLLNDLQASLSQCVDAAHSDVLSRLRTVEHGLQDTLGHQNDYFRSLIQGARQEGQIQDDLQILRLNELKKTVMAQGVTTATDSLAFKSRFNALDAKLLLLDGQVAAIRSEQLEFQAKIAADLLSLSTQIGDLVDYIRGGDAKKGEGSSSRPNLLHLMFKVKAVVEILVKAVVPLLLD